MEWLWFVVFLFDVIDALPRLNHDYDIWGDYNDSAVVFNNLGDNRSVIEAERFPRVLNFFPVPFEEECLSTDKRRNGICMNAYECRIQGGSSHGPCALGFGICCIFTSSCQGEIFNNITYFTNPDFPDLSRGMEGCNVTIKKIDPEIAQIRLDFIHFNLGQPNRRTGVCEEDVFLMSGGMGKGLTMCGLNSGQHAYFDVDNLDVNTPMEIGMKFSNKVVSRLWEVRVLQIPFGQRAPSGCLQYHTGSTGIIQTLNFAENGRHLAEQDYNICMRQEEGMCSIAYEPCDPNSFKIGPGNGGDPTGTPSGNPTEGGNPPGTPGPGSTSGSSPSGANDPGTAGQNPTESEDLDVGSGDGATGRNINMCTDKIIMPCNSEDLIMPQDAGPGYCELSHCGSSLCPNGETPCRIESTSTPFTIGVQFGPASREESPEDNLGVCLKFEQLPCLV